MQKGKHTKVGVGQKKQRASHPPPSATVKAVPKPRELTKKEKVDSQLIYRGSIVGVQCWQADSDSLNKALLRLPEDVIDALIDEQHLQVASTGSPGIAISPVVGLMDLELTGERPVIVVPTADSTEEWKRHLAELMTSIAHCYLNHPPPWEPALAVSAQAKAAHALVIKWGFGKEIEACRAYANALDAQARADAKRSPAERELAFNRELLKALRSSKQCAEKDVVKVEASIAKLERKVADEAKRKHGKLSKRRID